MVQVTVINDHPRKQLASKALKEYSGRVLKLEGRRRAIVTIVCVTSSRIRGLNRRFLNHDYATDVLAFPLGEEGRCEGEIYVNLDRVLPQARQYGVSKENEMARLIVHGTLHLAGYTDRNSKDREKMRRVEDAHVNYWFPKNGGRDSR